MPLWVVSLLGALIALFSVQAESPFDIRLDDFRTTNPISLNKCAFGIVVDQVARRAHVPAGFQNASGCGASPRSVVDNSFASDLSGLSVREAMDYLVAADSRFQWKAIDGVIVVRPTEAWQSQSDPLNLRAAAFSAVGMQQAVDGLLAAVPPLVLRRPTVAKSMDRPFTMSFQGGTMLDALGAVVRSYGEAIWQFGDVSEGDSILIVSPPEMGGGNATAHLGPFQSK